MLRLSARRLVDACIVTAAAVAALGTPGAASAFSNGTCEGAAIEGQGSSVQDLAQQTIWGPGFDALCAGEGGSSRVEKYHGNGPSTALESWGSGGAKAGTYGPSNAYIGFELAPNAIERQEIEDGDLSGQAHDSLLTIPVMQLALAVDVHLPTGCVATSTVAPGRLAFKNSTLEAIFAGKTKEWKLIKDFGDKFENASGKTCPILAAGAKTPITRVVRKELSGSTQKFEKYLYLESKGRLKAGDPEREATWNELAEERPNTAWPNEIADPPIRATDTSGVVKAVEATEGTIGVVALSATRVPAFTEPPGTGGPNTGLFWVPIENGKGKVADPATNGPEATAGNSNCEGTQYTNGKKKFPPASAEELWNEVNSSLKQTNYTLCGFTYDFALRYYPEFTGGAEAEEQTVSEYFQYVLGTGQAAILNTDFQPLPGNVGPHQDVLQVAEEGQEEIGGGFPAQLAFAKVGEKLELPKKSPVAEFTGETLVKVSGEQFKVFPCVGKLSSKCEIEVEYVGPKLAASLSKLTIEWEFPLLSANVQKETVRLVAP
jgi:ABC-type phosphate transport system substrate-binding protein